MDALQAFDADERAAASNMKAEIFFSKYLLFVALPFAVLMLFFTVKGTRNHLIAVKTESWPTTTGRITKVDLKQDNNRQWADVTYSYEVDGKSYFGDKVSFNSAATDYGDAQPFAEAHPKGSDVVVFYNPDSPKEAVLRPGPDVVTYCLFIFPIFMSLLSLNLILSVLRYNRFVATVNAGDFATIREACYKIGYGQTPMRALLVAAQRTDDGILKEVIKGSTAKEVDSVIAYCRQMGLSEASNKISALRGSDATKIAALERKRNLRTIVKLLVWILPLAAAITYLVMTQKK